MVVPQMLLRSPRGKTEAALSNRQYLAIPSALSVGDLRRWNARATLSISTAGRSISCSTGKKVTPSPMTSICRRKRRRGGSGRNRMGCRLRETGGKGGARSKRAKTVRRGSLSRTVMIVKKAKRRSNGGAKRRSRRIRRS